MVVAAVGAVYAGLFGHTAVSRCVPVHRVNAPASTNNSPSSEASIQALQESLDALVPPPTGSTSNATFVTDSEATLHGSVTPNREDTQVYFQYGLTADYGKKTVPVDAGSQHKAIPAAVRIIGLTPGTTYHYTESIETLHHLLAGADQCFTTVPSSFSLTADTPVPKPTPALEGPTQISPR